MATKHFVHLHQALRSLEADPATVRDPIKRTFVAVEHLNHLPS